MCQYCYLEASTFEKIKAMLHHVENTVMFALLLAVSIMKNLSPRDAKSKALLLARKDVEANSSEQ